MSVFKRPDGSYFEATYEQGDYYVELKNTNGDTIDGFSKPLEYNEAADLIALLNRAYDSGTSSVKQVNMDNALEYIQSYINSGVEALNTGSTLTTIDSVIDALNDIKLQIQRL